MTIYTLVYVVATGALQGRLADDYGAAYQTKLADHGLAAIDVPLAAWASDPLDLSSVRDMLAARVDVAAETERQLYLTPGEGQALTYSYKADEARRWSADNTVATPFLSAEATARSMTVAALAAEVLASVAAWTRIGAAIEGARMGAKTAIVAAATLPALVAASTVDWTAVTAPEPTPAPEPKETTNG